MDHEARLEPGILPGYHEGVPPHEQGGDPVSAISVASTTKPCPPHHAGCVAHRCDATTTGSLPGQGHGAFRALFSLFYHGAAGHAAAPLPLSPQDDSFLRGFR